MFWTQELNEGEARLHSVPFFNRPLSKSTKLILKGAYSLNFLILLKSEFLISEEL